MKSDFYWREKLSSDKPKWRRRGQTLAAFVKRIRQMRSHGMTQAAVARQLGVSKRYVQSLEKRAKSAAALKGDQ